MNVVAVLRRILSNMFRPVSILSPAKAYRVWAMATTLCVSGLSLAMLGYSFVSLLGCSRPNSTDAPVRTRVLAPTSAYAYFFLSQLGVSPTSLNDSTTPGVSTIENIQRVAKSVGQRLLALSLSEYMDAVQTHGVAVLEEENGELHVILGIVTSDDEQYVQMIRGQSEPTLVAISELRGLSVKHVWITESPAPACIPLRVGNATLELDRLWHNFGLAEPFSKPSTVFHLGNTGNAPFAVHFLSTSCGCTTVSFADGTVLHPGDTMDLSAFTATADRTSITQTVSIKVIDQATKSEQDIVLTLLGNQVPILSFSPGVMDFGFTRQNDKPVVRTVRLFQTVHDHFHVVEVQSHGHPIQAEIKGPPDESKNRMDDPYHLVLTLDPATATPGVHKSTIDVLTSSRYRPLVQIPVEWRVPYRVESIPRKAAFGIVGLGSIKEQRINLISPNGEAFTAEVLTSPPKCDARIERRGSSAVLIVRPHFQEGGIYKQTVVVRASSQTWVEDVEIECVALVKL